MARPIDRKSSIESEPRTLSFEQLQLAREEAMYVVRTRRIEEAVHIFTQGMEPVRSTARDMNGEMMMRMVVDVDLSIGEREQARVPLFRDISSAPF